MWPPMAIARELQPEQDDRDGERCQVVGGSLPVAEDDPSMLREVVDQPLHDSPLPVGVRIEAARWLLVSPRREDGLDTSLLHVPPVRGAVVPLGRLRWAGRELSALAIDHLRIRNREMRRSGCRSSAGSHWHVEETRAAMVSVGATPASSASPTCPPLFPDPGVH